MDLLQGAATAFQKLLDDNQLIFRYNEKVHKFSLIKADYFLEGCENKIPSFLFLGNRNCNEKEQMCRTFFELEIRTMRRDNHNIHY